MKIINADIGVMPKEMFDDMPVVTVTYEDNSTEELFSYYPDEIQFTPQEFIGLTKDESFELKHKKDVSYLRS